MQTEKQIIKEGKLIRKGEYGTTVYVLNKIEVRQLKKFFKAIDKLIGVVE